MATSRGKEQGAGPEFRVDELARVAGTTVRNVRAYQDRGLLPPPRRQGRVAWYSGVHLARLRLVAALLERGYTLANIAELVAAWERGQDVGALLGLEAVLGGADATVAAERLSGKELAARVGPDAAGFVEEAAALGLLAPDGPDRYRVLNPAALEVGALLARAGVPLPAVLLSARRLSEDMGDVARQFVELVDVHVFEPLGDPPPASEVARLAQLVERLRPLAADVVTVELARAMDAEIARRFGEHLQRFAQSFQAAVAHDAGPPPGEGAPGGTGA